MDPGANTRSSSPAGGCASFRVGRRREGVAGILLWIAILLTSGWLSPSPTRAADSSQNSTPSALVTREALQLLKAECFVCHNPEKKKGGLLLTSREGVLKGGEEGRVIDGEHPEKSCLLEVLVKDADPHMPPKKFLSDAQRRVLGEWVRAGVPWDATALLDEEAVAPVALRSLPADYHPATAVRLSPDGSRLAVARGGWLSVYEVSVTTNRLILERELHPEGIQSLAWSADGATIATGGFQNAGLWSSQTLLPQRRWHEGLSGRITALEFAPDGRSIVLADGVAGKAGVLRQLPLAEGSKEPVWNVHGDTVFDLEFSRDGHRLVTAGGDRLIKVWEWPSRQLVSVLEGHSAQVLCVAFNTNATLVASGGADRELKIWDVATHEKLITLGQHTMPITAVIWASELQTLFASRDDGSVFRYTNLKAHNGEQSSDSGQEHRLQELSSGVISLAASSDAKTVVVGTHDGSVKSLTHEGKVQWEIRSMRRAPVEAGAATGVEHDLAGLQKPREEGTKPTLRRGSRSLQASRVTAIRIDPSRLKLEAGSSVHQVLVTARTEDGFERDVTTQARFETGSLSPFSMEVYGAVRPIRAGSGTLTARYEGKSFQIPIEVTGPTSGSTASSDREISFVRDVLPMLSRAGCNAGACHAKPEGQNGFKLSVFSYDPAHDYGEIVRECRGRRVFPAAPEQSLLIQKPTTAVPHEGGLRFKPGSETDLILRAWMRQGMPFTATNEPSLGSIEVFPRERRYGKGTTQRLLVQARYSDGSVRDVTRLAAFVSNDKEIAKVDESGVIEIGTLTGQGVVVARYMGFVADAQIMVPADRQLPESLYATLPRNNFVDDLAYEQCRRLGIVPSEPCSDAEFLRRSKLDAIGQLPTPAEVREFLADSSPDKRSRWIRRVLNDPAYVDYWANKWTDLLRPNPDRVGVKSIFVLDQWVRDSFRKNQPYDEFVRDILLAEGSNHRDGPAVIYRDRREPADLTTMFSQLFLGTRLECAKCHHHPNEKWAQEDFYQFAAFFGPLKQKGAGLSPPISAGTETFFFSPGGAVKHPVTGKVLAPRAPEGPELNLDSDADPRRALADWLTGPDNPFFARAAVNRIWAAFFGRGLVEPVDDFRISNPCVNPALLNALAEDFVRHRFDRKHLMQVLMESRTYQLSSTPTTDNLSDTRHFSRAYRRRLPAEVLLDAVNTVTGVSDTLTAMPIGSRATQAWSYKIDSQFLDAFGRPNASSDCPCERDLQLSVVQSLHLMNSKSLQAKLASASGRIQQWVESPLTPDQIVEELYLATLSRLPTPAELRRAGAAFKRKEATRRTAVEDLCWALLNSPEFVFNH